MLADNLRGGRAPQHVIDAHRGMSASDTRLLVIDQQISAAAKDGDVALIRALKSEKEILSRAAEEKHAMWLARFEKREVTPPARGEEARLGGRARRLEAAIGRKQGQRQKLLNLLAGNPEDEVLLAKMDLLNSQLPELEGELETISARREEIARWYEEREREQERAVRRREFDAKAPKLQARLESVVSEVLHEWEVINAGLLEINSLLAELDDAEMRNPRLAGSVFERINEATAGAISFDALGWKLLKVIRR
jgi:hypothetical protein